jgi:hypothetical protein
MASKQPNIAQSSPEMTYHYCKMNHNASEKTWKSPKTAKNRYKNGLEYHKAALNILETDPKWPKTARNGQRQPHNWFKMT